MNQQAPETNAMRYYGSHAGWNQLSIEELWSYRELFWAFAMRELKVRYRQALIGVLWAIIQPVSKMLIFSLIFGLLNAKPQSAGNAGIPYIHIALAGLIVWEFFASVMRDAGDILVNQRNMLTKIYFPRILLPAAVTVTAGLDFLIGWGLLTILLMLSGYFFSWKILMAIVYLAWLVVFALAWGVTFSCLNVLYRDIRFVVPLMLQIGFFVSPVVYEYRALVKNANYDWLAGINPMVTIIEGFRSAVTGTGFPGYALWIPSLLVTVISVGIGIYTYITIEQKMADNL